MSAAVEAPGQLHTAPRRSVEVSEPFPPWALPVLWGWIESFRDRVCDDFSPKTFPEFLENWIARAKAGTRTWGVWRDDSLGGMISVGPLNPILAETHLVFARRFWGRETTIPALRQAYAIAFASGFEKLQAAVFADNYQLIALAKAIGAVEETHPKHPLRAQTRRNGKPVDMRLISLFKEDFECHSKLPESAPA
jgi:RimJ/RimL family protein N-acetyltransferase